MKIIKYNFCTKTNNGTEEDPQIVETLTPMKFECKTQVEFDANYPIAEKEAVPGSIDVTGEFDPEPEIPSEVSVWDELDAAYQRGVDSV